MTISLKKMPILSKEQKEKIKLAKECGLTFVGFDDEGEAEYIGYSKAWKKFDDADVN